MSNKLMSRRTFLRSAALSAAGAAVVACQPQTVIVKETVEVEKVVEQTVVVKEEVEKEVTKIVTEEKVVEKVVEVTAVPQEIKEAPDLFTQVAEGKLPPVSERMPTDVRVVNVYESIGQYGGTWRRVCTSPGDVGAWNSRLSYDCPLRYEADAATIVPHVVKGFEVGDNGASFTWFLRKGHKFSDGMPFTADDIMYWWEDSVLNEEMTPAGPSTSGMLAVKGQPVEVEKIDDYTVKWSFADSYGLFIPWMASTRYNWCWSTWPKHYLSQFHPTYTERAAVQKMATDEGFDDWIGLHGNRRDWRNVELPSNRIWAPERMPPDIPSTVVRNPYYWVVDPEGNQLPYIDRLRFEVVDDINILNLKAVAGAVDMQMRHLSWENFPLFFESAEQGDYHVIQWTMAEGAQCCFHFNLNHQDPGLRELQETKEFRQALSIAIDREEVQQVVYQGLGVPRQASVLPTVLGYKPEQSEAWAQYDPETANQMLDAIGLTERDAEGFRLRLDGESLTINCEYAPVFGPWGPVAEMVAKYWADIGIRMFPKEESRDLFSERGNEGTVQDMSIWTMDRCAHPLLDPLYWMPRRGGTPASVGALYWDWWNSNGEQGEEPPPDVLKSYELYEACKTAKNDEELKAYSEELFDLNADQIWFIGVVGLLPHIGVVKNYFMNVPDGPDNVSDWLCLSPGNTTVEQYWMAQA
ncbi:MAG: ABC transporter substrate-binding protein [Anaerolineae bacterium]|nr:ABC transporter substrate-binding protein [Anaerolineae bacterium]